jgi:protein-disulfide isomerase
MPMRKKKEDAWLVDPVTERDHLRGSLQAEVTVVEYGDYECPFSAETYAHMNRLQELWGDKVCFAYRHFPKVRKHPHAELAAEAAEEAGAEGTFWAMHDMLFVHQEALEVRDLMEYARTLELDMFRFAHKLSEHAHHERIVGDKDSGVRSGVKETPAVFINGRRFKGDTSDFAQLQAALEAAAA